MVTPRRGSAGCCGPALAVAPAVLRDHIHGGGALAGGSPVLRPAAIVAPGVPLIAAGGAGGGEELVEGGGSRGLRGGAPSSCSAGGRGPHDPEALLLEGGGGGLGAGGRLSGALRAAPGGAQGVGLGGRRVGAGAAPGAGRVVGVVLVVGEAVLGAAVRVLGRGRPRGGSRRPRVRLLQAPALQRCHARALLSAMLVEGSGGGRSGGGGGSSLSAPAVGLPEAVGWRGQGGRVGRGRLLRRLLLLRRPHPVADAAATGRLREVIVQGGGGSGGPGARVPVRALQVGLGPCAPSVALGRVLQLLPRGALALRLLLAAALRRRLTPRLLRGTIPLLRLRFLQLGWSRGAQAAGGGGDDLSSHDPPLPA